MRSSRTAMLPRTSAFGLRMGGVRRARGRGPGGAAARARRARGSRAPCRSPRSRAASASGWRWRARSHRSRGCCCSTSLSARSTARFTTASSPSCASCSTGSGRPRVYVTHDVAEAFAIGTLVAVMRDGSDPPGRERRSGSGLHPADAWVARFIGLANVEELGAISRVTRPEAVVLRADASRRRDRGRRLTATGLSSRSAPATTTAVRSHRRTQGSSLRCPARASRSRSIRAAVIEVPTSISS